MHKDLLKALTPVARTSQPPLRASLLESAVRGLRRQGYAVRLGDERDDSAAALTLERGSRFLAVRVASESPAPAAEVERVAAALQGDPHKVGVLVTNGPLTTPAHAAAAQAHVRVLNAQDDET